MRKKDRMKKAQDPYLSPTPKKTIKSIQSKMKVAGVNSNSVKKRSLKKAKKKEVKLTIFYD